MTSESKITIVEESPDTLDSIQLINELDAQLTSHDYPQESRHAFSVDKLLRENVAFFVIRYNGAPAGCGGIKLFDNGYGEVKRMYVRPEYRGLGLAKGILKRLTHHALMNGINVLRLETGIHQVEAIGLYESFGFEQRAPFGTYKEDPMSVYFELTVR